MNMIEMVKKSRKAARKMAVIGTRAKNQALLEMANAIEIHKEKIFKANEEDLKRAHENQLDLALIDRLKLNESRINSMKDGLVTMASLPDPIGNIEKGWTLENGLQVASVRVPLGVIAMIYESRPNVTADASGLALKSGNSIILRGGKEALNTNKVLADILCEAVCNSGLPEGVIQLVPSSDKELVKELVSMEDMVDVVIPRGGPGLKRAIVSQAKVPVIITGAGLCHTYVDREANLEMAKKIVINAKTQRPGVCNALETLLVHKNVDSAWIQDIVESFQKLGVSIYGCTSIQKISTDVIPAKEENWHTEYHAMAVNMKVVDSVHEAIDHIENCGTKHSEAIVTENIHTADKFLKSVDAATVYVNASTRFTDGSVFGLGGEIGISTQKLHARGPMGLEALTTTKYQIRGEGQIRE